MAILVAILVFIIVYHLVHEAQRRKYEPKRPIVLDFTNVEVRSLERERLYEASIRGTCYTECGGGESDDRRDSTQGAAAGIR